MPPPRRGAKPEGLESQHTVGVVDFLRWKGWRATHIRNNAPHCVVGDPGWPDIVAVKDGRILCIELKMPGRKPTADQTLWHEALKDAGAEVHVLTVPDHWKTLDNLG